MSDSKSEKKIPDSVNATPGISVDSVIRYWRNSLSDEKMIGISRKEMRKGSGVKFEELKSGGGLNLQLRKINLSSISNTIF